MPRIDDYLTVLNIAQEALPGKNPAEICRNTGVRWDSSGKEKNGLSLSQQESGDNQHFLPDPKPTPLPESAHY
ncbi:MAG: hypothetical protein QMD03_01915 [Syntrophales bacterium]|nr:hypothetical protein [Syntrophales bacterium]